jgi:hypothetical protein
MGYDDLVKETPAIDQCDCVSASQFAELWWSEERPGDDRNDDAYRKFLENKQAQMRMMRRKFGDFPVPDPKFRRRRRLHDSNSHAYALGDFVEWCLPDVPDSVRLEALEIRATSVHPFWHLERALDEGASSRRSSATLQLVVASVAAWRVPRRGDEDLDNYLAWALSRGESGLQDIRASDGEIAAEFPSLEGVFRTLLYGIAESRGSSLRIMDAVEFVLESGTDPSDVLDLVLDRMDTGSWVSGASTQGSSSLNKLMSLVAHPKSGQTILDLTAGEGGLLLALAAESDGPLDLVGIEFEPEAWAVA